MLSHNVCGSCTGGVYAFAVDSCHWKVCTISLSISQFLLPDAMEGPTPVSALIHAATMVTTRVFLIIRLSPPFEKVPSILVPIVLIGSVTAFFSSTIDLTQNDFKNVIAYSTCSQLGYMVLVCGFSCYELSLYHLINHRFFKAVLFLSVGSVIHALSDEQDLRKGGSLLSVIPITFAC